MNESLRANSNYPPMSDLEWLEAPFNQPDPPEKTFNLAISCSLSKDVQVDTDDYGYGARSDDAPVINNPWNEYTYSEKTIEEILVFAKECAQYFLSHQDYKVKPKYTLMKLAKSCEGWTIDEENAEQV